MTTDELEKRKQKRLALLTAPLTTRQHRLKDFLLENFVSGKYFTIEEIVANVKDSEGKPYYKLNTNPYTHDKCVLLGADVKQMNWKTGVNCYIPIIKDSKGSIKLAENKQELTDYIDSEKKKVEQHYQYYNHLTAIADMQDTIPFINQANRVLEDDELQPVEVFKN